MDLNQCKTCTQLSIHGVICKVDFTVDLSHWDVYKQGMCWLMLKQNSGEMVLVLWQPIHSSSGMQIS